MTLTPSFGRRLSNSSGAVATAALLAALAASAASSAAISGFAVAAAVLLVVAVRAWRLAVIVTDSAVVVRGWLKTRTIDREAIVGVTDWPAVMWTSGHRTRSTPLYAFYRVERRSGPRFTVEDLANLDALRAALGFS